MTVKRYTATITIEYDVDETETADDVLGEATTLLIGDAFDIAGTTEPVEVR